MTISSEKQTVTQKIAGDKKSSIRPQVGMIKCLSFFSGAMGLDLGLEQAGITTLLASEIDKSCRKTIVENKPNIGLIGDIREYTKDEILEMAGLSASDEVEIMAGGPPCQAFSTAGKRKGFEDERGNVFLKYIDLILEIRPRFAIIENVRGILSAPLHHIPHKYRNSETKLTEDELKGGALLHIINKLRKGGYSVSFNLYNAANFGSPQIRERVVILCSRDGKKVPYLNPTHSENGDFGLPAWKTLKQALKTMEECEQQYIPFPEKRLYYYRMLKGGQNWRSLPEKMQKEALGNSYYAGGGKTGFLRRLDWNKPCPTLVTSPAMPATDLAHPEKDRPLSVQEYKRVQEFPDDWKFSGSISDQYRQIGNAVPISLGRAIGNTIIACLRGNAKQNIKDFKYSRYLNTDEKSWEKSILSMRQTHQQQSLLTFCK